ncbi:MAG TPA: hypothetical protein VD927_10765 [Chryseosolibacter sp.]|nr:hypothetical protein [Chryseosolibacter sp.]
MEKNISFQFKARYYQTSEITKDTRAIWFVLHGYGQLAQYFIRKFSVLAETGVCVIAPEGLSRFYLENIQEGGRKNDRVGATWMTKENRLMDIDNYIEYLTSIYQQEVVGKIPVTILGFSQGSATATRWALSGKVDFERLILWSGIFPPDMDFQNGGDLLRNKEVRLVYGKQDPFLSDARFTEMEILREKLAIEIMKTEFDGAHDIDQRTLLTLI